MSDPVSNAEVEDVLSSIRRLVSEEKRNPTEAIAAAPANDRLVLTPALRVAEDRATPREEAEAAAEHSQAVELRAEESPVQDADHTQFDTSPNDVGDDTPDASALEDMQELAEADETGHDADRSEVVHDDVPHSLELGGEEERLDRDWDVRHGAEDAPDLVEVDAVSEGETDAKGDPQQEVFVQNTADEGDTPQEDNDPHTQDTFEDQSADVAFDTQAELSDGEDENTEGEVPVAEPVDAFEQMSSAASLGAKIAALETVVARQDDEWEPDDAGNSDYAGTEAPGMTWEDAETVDAVDNDSAHEDVFGAAEDILDEDALRDLVSDIVREELQGALGERITRNVRKLVRREIHRALAAQELE